MCGKEPPSPLSLDHQAVSLSLSLSLSLSHFPDTLNSVFAARTALLGSERERFCVSLTCERERYIPSLCSLHPPLSPPSIGIDGVGVVVVDVVVVVALAASCLQATVGCILWITPRMSERRDAAPPRRRHNNPARRRNPPSIVQKRRR